MKKATTFQLVAVSLLLGEIVPAMADAPAPPGGPLAAPGAAAPPAVGRPTQPGARVAIGQAPVVAGNSAGARERALGEAIRQAVDAALVDLCDASTRAAQGKAIKAIEARARTFVPSYRTLEEGEANGLYTVRLEAEVDEVGLRRNIDRWTAGPAAGPPARAGAAGLLVVPSDRTGETAALAPAVTAALSSAGVRARLADASLIDDGLGAEPSPASAAQAATASALEAAVLVGATATDEGAVRGTGKVALACQGKARLIAASGGRVLAERAATARVFVDRPEAGRPRCLARLAADLAGQLAAGSSAAPSGSAGLRTLTLDADVAEPAAVAALLKSVRSVGAVSAAELRHVGAGRVEIQVRTRAAAGPLSVAISRDAASTLALSDLRPDGDVIHLKARLRAALAPEGGSSP